MNGPQKPQDEFLHRWENRPYLIRRRIKVPAFLPARNVISRSDGAADDEDENVMQWRNTHRVLNYAIESTG